MHPAFRSSFQFPKDKNILRWFPGHMDKGMKQMKQKLKTVDCLVEIHDARIPLSGRNPNFKHTVSGIRPHILALNKKDLADMSLKGNIVNSLKDQGISHIIFTNCKDHKCDGMKQVVPLLQKLVSATDRFNRSEEKSYCMMVIGVPNVGKSSFINHLRNKYLKKGNAAPVGAVAGITRSVMSKIKVSEDPLIYVLDTPGILTPTLPDFETGIKLALCATMKDHLVGNEFIADYLLYRLNKAGNFSYVPILGLTEPIDNILELLTVAAVKMGRSIKVHEVMGGYKVYPDREYAASYFIKLFRDGKFGRVLLDEEILTKL